jgi:hypothetical protein
MTPLDQFIFVVGLFVSCLCLAFLYRSFVELRRIDAQAEGPTGNAGSADSHPPKP